MLKNVSKCRICGSPLKDILDLGENFLPYYLNSDTPVVKRKVPIILSRCDTSCQDSCGFVQLRHTVPGNLLYNNYFYQTGVNEHMVKHVTDLADKGMKIANINNRQDIIVDIGCNDGTLLGYYINKGCERVFGFDPAKNISKISKNTGANVIEDYFCYDSSIEGAKLITSIAMFYDLDDPHSFVKDIKKSLHKLGVWITEQSYLPSMMKVNSFDTICHEHLGYYSFFTLEKLLSYHDLEIIDVFLNDVNGGSFQVYVAHKGSFRVSEEANLRMQKIRIQEFNMKLDTSEPYDAFAERIISNKIKVLEFLSSEKRRGKSIFAYGASTKGFITLQYYGLDNEIITACADRNEKKWGLEIIGSNIPIISEKDARYQSPDYFFVLPWHFIKGFLEREKEFLNNGGKFIVPMPEFKIYDKDSIIQ